jgi:hypothetical protein
MNLSQLIKQMDDIERGAPSFKKYINESVYAAPEMERHWRKLDEGFFKGYDQYLKEVALTPDQIQNIFKQAGSTGGGADATKDPGKLAAIVDKVLPTSQAANLEKSLPAPDAGPVQGFEQKAASAVQSLPGVDSGTKQSLMQLVKAGIKKPETQQLILAAVGAGLGSLISKVGPILSMIPGGGPIASAITGAVVAGGVAVLAAKLRGEDWKSAFKGAIKPALMGGASAVIGNLATTAIGALTSGGSGDGADQGSQATPGASLGVGQKLPDGEVISALDSSNPNAAVTITRPDGSTYSVSHDTALQMTGQQGISPQATGPVSQGASSDPMAGVSNTPAANGQKELTPAQSDKMTAATMRAGLGADVTNQQPTDAPADAPIRPRLPPGASLSDFSNTSGGSNAAPADSGGAIEPRGGWGAQEKINAMMQAKADAEYAAQQGGGSPNAIGKNFDAGIAPLGPDGTPMRAVPMDTGPTAGGVPVGSTPDGINRLSGKPISSGPTWDQMTPDQQAAVTARQQQQAADAAQGAQNAKDYWANKPAYTRGLKESFAECAYVDKQATLKMWLEQEARGLAVSGLALKPSVKEGVLDSIKGMFGGKKDAAAPAAGGGITADALNKAWTAAGSPTDSEEVAKVLQSAGVPAETVTKIFTDLKLPEPTGKVDPTLNPETPAADTPTAPAADATPTDTPAAPAAAQDPAAAPADAKTTAPAAEPPATPAAQQQSKVGVGQINKIVPTLRVRDLKSVQKTVDTTLAKRGQTAQPTAEGKYSGFYSKFLGKEI